MKISILITDGAKQIMLTPETDHEKQALKFIQPNDALVAVSKWGSFTDVKEIVGVSIAKSQGGTYRAYETEDSLMFIIKDNKPLENIK
jgi:hypothetical protein